MCMRFKVLNENITPKSETDHIFKKRWVRHYEYKKKIAY